MKRLEGFQEKKNEKKMALKCLQTNQIDILKMFALEKNS